MTQLYSKQESHCTEAGLQSIAQEMAPLLKRGDRILIEGPLGAGKSTLVRSLLLALGVEQPPEGSPTFAIAHEYVAPIGEVVHIDYYRLRHESEIDDSGIPSYYWERNLIVISEWLSSWPEFRKKVLNSGRIWTISLGFGDLSSEMRHIDIRCLGRS